MIDLRTTLAGFDLTLATMAEISRLIERLDGRLAELHPELPRLGSLSADGDPIHAFAELLTTYEHALAAIDVAARAAAALGFGGDATFSAARATAPMATPVAAPKKVKANVDEAAPELLAAAPSAQPEVATEKATAKPEPVAEPLQLVVEENESPVDSSVTAKLEVVESFTPIQQTPSAPTGQHLRAESDLVKPLKPIEMPSAEYAVGPMLCHGPSIIYAHGSEIKKYWPGASTVKGTLAAEIPNESWRLLSIDSNLFCIHEESVSVLSIADLHNVGKFEGKFVAQARTENNWVGVRNDKGVLATMFKDKKGSAFAGGAKLGEFGDQRIFVQTAGDAAFVAIGSGDIFAAEGTSAEHISNSGKFVEIAGLAVHSDGLLVTNRNSDGVWLTTLDHNGKPVLRSGVLAKYVSHEPVIVKDQVLLFDDAASEVVTISLDTLQEERRSRIEGVTAVGRMIAIADADGCSLALMAETLEARPNAVYLHSLNTGATTKICQLSATKADIGFAEGHLVVTSTSSMQNLIQVFNIYSAAMAKAA